MPLPPHVSLPHKLQRHHDEELQNCDPVDGGITQHPVPCVQNGILVHEVLGSNAQDPYKAAPCATTAETGKEKRHSNESESL